MLEHRLQPFGSHYLLTIWVCMGLRTTINDVQPLTMWSNCLLLGSPPRYVRMFNVQRGFVVRSVPSKLVTCHKDHPSPTRQMGLDGLGRPIDSPNHPNCKSIWHRWSVWGRHIPIPLKDPTHRGSRTSTGDEICLCLARDGWPICVIEILAKPGSYFFERSCLVFRSKCLCTMHYDLVVPCVKESASTLVE